MILKDYQTKVVSALQRFLQTAQTHQQTAAKTTADQEKARALLPENLRHLVPATSVVNWVQQTFSDLNLPQPDAAINGLNEAYPRMCVKVPTGGAKHYWP